MLLETTANFSKKLNKYQNINRKELLVTFLIDLITQYESILLQEKEVLEKIKEGSESVDSSYKEIADFFMGSELEFKYEMPRLTVDLEQLSKLNIQEKIDHLPTSKKLLNMRLDDEYLSTKGDDGDQIQEFFGFVRDNFFSTFSG